MATSAERQPLGEGSVKRRAGMSWIFLGLIAVLFLVFAGLGVYYFLHRDQFESDAEAMARLESAKLPEAPRVTVGDWPQWRGPNRDGVSGETGLLTQWPDDGPEVLTRVVANTPAEKEITSLP